MATAQQLTDPFLSTYVPVPAVTAGVCAICHSWTETRADGSRAVICPSCNRTTAQVSHPLRLVVPISLTRTDVQAQLHTVLRDFKAEYIPLTVRERHRLQVAALLVRFLGRHRAHVKHAAGTDWDTIVAVPSTRGRPGDHPLAQAIDLTSLRDERAALLTATGIAVGHNNASDRAYEAVAGVEGRRVLLVDDTFTTGARVQSAATTLTAAGTHVVAAVVLGRVVQPGYNTEAKALWAAQSARQFDFDICCLE